MIAISSQMREFVNFAQDAVANDARNAIARLGAKASRHSAFSIGAATDGDGVGKLRRSGASKNANNTVRTEFRRTVAQVFGGEAALDIDGMPVLIAEAQGDALLVSGLVGDPPPEGRAEFCHLLLEANAGFFDAAPCTLARNPESGCYMLLRRFEKASLDPDSFAKELASFADTLAEWREALESFRPAAAAAAETKRTESARPLSPDGFIAP